MNYLAFKAEKKALTGHFRPGTPPAKVRGMKTTLQRAQRGGVPELVLAAHAGRESEVRALLESGADVNAADGDGITPLMAAAMSGSQQLARLLLSAGADRRLCNKWGMSAHAIALWHGHEALAALLGDSECSHCGTERAFGQRSLS